jgi:hypothetical protein
LLEDLTMNREEREEKRDGRSTIVCTVYKSRAARSSSERRGKKGGG